MPKSIDKLIWLAVDLDLTLANSSGAPDYELNEPIAENVEKLRQCVALGYKVIIHTARHWEQYSYIEDWLNENDIPFKTIICGKLLAHRYIDDKAIPADANWVDYL